MQVLYLTFANSQDQPLPSLQEEEDQVCRLLAPRALKQHFLLFREPYATIEKIGAYLTQCREQITLFLYSGHAGRDQLILGDKEARAEGIAHLLGRCARYNLKVVVLNGCSTGDQVEALLDAGVPVVIATSAPVEDTKAKKFSIRFFQALSEYASYGEAFELAVGEVMTYSAVAVHRGYVQRSDVEEDRPTWGIFYREANEGVLEEKLPHHASAAPSENYQPNAQLTAALWDFLAPYSKEIRLRKAMEAEGDTFRVGDKHIAILHSLPRPVAEHLRKLMAPVESETQGYDKVGEARIREMVVAFETTMEFLAFILLSELWAARSQEKTMEVSAETQALTAGFLDLKKQDKAAYDFEPLLRSLSKTLGIGNYSMIVEELKTLDEIFEQKEAFRDACFFFNLLRRSLLQGPPAPYEYQERCIRGEESLVAIFKELAFLARYTLAAVKNIDVLHYPHLYHTQFSHVIVKLMRVFGKLEEEEMVLNRVLYNRAVLLFKVEPNAADQATRELCLSPFIIDENAYYLKTDLSKLYFYHYCKPALGSYVYKHINRPDDPLLEANADKYQLAKAQFDVFREAVLGAKPSPV